MSNYVAFYAASCEYEEFETFEEAQTWLIEYDSDGFADESVNGENYIAKITHVSSVVIDERKEDYHEHDDNCPEDCDEEEWPYCDEWEYSGEIKYVLKEQS